MVGSVCKEKSDVECDRREDKGKYTGRKERMDPVD